MLSKISIANFKAIKETPLVLDGLASVNYLIGPNGCGKSSVLEALYETAQNFDSLTSYFSGYFCKAGLDFEMILQEKQTDYKINIKSCAVVSKNEEFFISSYFESVILIDRFDDFEQNVLDIDEPKFNLVKRKTLEILTNFDIEDELDFGNFERQNGNLMIKVKSSEKFYFYKEIASGKKLIISLIFSLAKISVEINSTQAITKTRKKYTILIDEPEKNLHPKYQKLLPKILTKFFDWKVQFIIATHSPFIISSAAEFEDSQKVYLLEKGQTKDAESGELNTEKSQLGYTGGECLLAVNEMLGLEVSDYSPHIIIFCERSLKILLKQIFQNHKTKFEVILTDQTGEDNNISRKVEIWDIVQKADKSNILGYKIYGITDKFKSQNQEQNWKKILGDKLIVSNAEELELLYPVNLVNDFLRLKNLPAWEPATQLSFCQDYKNYLIKQNVGITKDNFGRVIKNGLAEFIGGRVDKNFVKTISSDLFDILF